MEIKIQEKSCHPWDTVHVQQNSFLVVLHMCMHIKNADTCKEDALCAGTVNKTLHCLYKTGSVSHRS